MVKPNTLVLLYGGQSGEHEISLRSAASVLQHLNADKYHIVPIGMDKEGRCYQNDYQEMLAYKDSLPVQTPHSKNVPSLLVDGRFAIPADVVFPVVHGPLYEDGCLQGLLELAGVAYIGCGVLSSAIGMDKDMARRLACGNGIQSARYRVLSWHSSASARQQFCQEIVDAYGWPLFVKPCSLGSSVGIHKVSNLADLTHAVEDALRYDETILVEEYIQGREIELSVLESTSHTLRSKASVAGEICVRHPDGFYSYTAKYMESGLTDLVVPAKLNAQLLEQLQTIAVEIFTRLKCKGMARVDFFVNEERGKIYFNEINTIPGFTSISMYPKLWEASGLPYAELLEQLIMLALTHHRCREQRVTNYQ